MIKKLVISLLVLTVLTGQAYAENVKVNTKSHIYHTLVSNHARKCKKSCKLVSRNTAITIFHARPCKVCYKKHKKH